jgi:hypothetical protein
MLIVYINVDIEHLFEKDTFISQELLYMKVLFDTATEARMKALNPSEKEWCVCSDHLRSDFAN